MEHKTSRCIGTLGLVLSLTALGCSDDPGTGPGDTGEDTVAPAVITDLRITTADYNKITLTWTAPGDDGAEGKAAFYDIRYQTEVITDENWNDAEWCLYVPEPDTAGTVQSYDVLGLAAGVNCYFAIRTNDDGGNRSSTSNNVSGQVSSLFSDPVEYAAGHWPSWPTAADLDGDGDLDLAIAHSSSLEGNLTILMNNGAGRFQQTAAYTAGSNPRWITSADLNGDGDIDLAIADFNLSRVMTLQNRGDGTFAGPAYHEIGFTGSYIATADFNSDGAADLAVKRSGTSWPVNTPGSLEVMLNNGAGTSFTVDRVSGTPGAFDLGDIDGDGDVDIVATYSTVIIYRNNGAGTSWSLFDIGIVSNSAAVVVAKLNDDSAPDIFVKQGYEQAAVLLNNGSGDFPAQSVSQMGKAAKRFVAADFDSDGIDDIAGMTTENIVLLLGDGTGGFHGAAVYEIGYETYAILPADVNGDGGMDIVVTRPSEGEIVILLNRAG